MLVADEAVRVVIDNEDSVPTAEIGDLRVKFLRRAGTRGHARIVGPHHFHAGEVHRLQGVKIRHPALFGHEVILDHFRFGNPGGRRIGGIARIRDQHLVAGVEEGERDQEDTLLGTRQGLDFGSRIQRHAIVAGVPVGEGLAKFGKAHVALVAMDTVLHGRLRDDLQGGPGRSSVGGTDSEVDDGVFTAGGALPVELGHLPVLDGEEILFDGLSPLGRLDDHKAAWYSPRMSRSSRSGRTAVRACW